MTKASLSFPSRHVSKSHEMDLFIEVWASILSCLNRCENYIFWVDQLWSDLACTCYLTSSNLYVCLIEKLVWASCILDSQATMLTQHLLRL